MRLNKKPKVITDIQKNPIKLKEYNPATLKQVLEAEGYKSSALTRGSYKGILFEEGGGYIILFDGDRLLMYYPEEKSHHETAYNKISDGNNGIKRFDLNGRAIDL